jgi:two-component system NarL family sensor kinase
VPQFAQDGSISAVINSFTNITERKRAEEALHQLSTRLLQLQDEERRRLGRELHDSLAQSVLAVNLNLAQVTQSLGSLDQRSRHALSEARRVLQEMSREIRTLSYLLHPPVLDELGLVSAVKEYAEGFSERSGIRLELKIQAGFGRLPQEPETALFRIVQESLSNIQRHSGSQTAKIRLHADSGWVNLEVSDLGRGMDKGAIDRGNGSGTRLGVGILGMRERMKQLGGRLEIESSSSGTTVRVAIPLEAGALNAGSHPGSG